MDPIFLQIGSFTIAWYGVLMTAGLMSGAAIAQYLAKKRGLNTQIMSDLVFWAVIWGIVGARIGFILTSPSLFQNASFMDYINIRQGGLSVHGAVIAGILTGVYYKYRYNLNFYHYGDLFAPMLGLGIIGGRLGNIMNGSDTVGRVTNWSIGFRWPDSALGFHSALCNPANPENLAQYCVNGIMTAPVHYTQMYGVIIGVIITGLAFVWLRSKRPGWTFWQAILWYSILRAGVEETFRLNPLMIKYYLAEGLDQAGIGLFTTTQVVSIPLVLVSIVMLILIRRQPEPKEPVVANPETPEVNHV